MKKLSFFIIFIFMFSFALAQNVTKEDAIVAISQAKDILVNMQGAGFSVDYVNDSIFEMEKTFMVADYAEILRGNYSTSEKNEARSALRLVDWKEVYYANVIPFLDDLKERKTEAYEIYDSLLFLDKQIISLKNEGFNVSEIISLYNTANSSFYSERYNESRDEIEKLRLGIEKVSSENAKLNVFSKNLKTFIVKNWLPLLVALIVFSALVYLIVRRIRLYYLISRVHHSRAELVALNKLVLVNQEERYKKNKISGLVYNIRAKKYSEKINETQELLDMWQKKLSEYRKESL
jgi:hypothetical protein